VPQISNVMVLGTIRDAREKALKNGEAPRDAWLLECIQNDRLNPLPCTPEDIKKYPDGKLAVATPDPAKNPVKPTTGEDAGAGDGGSSAEDDDLMKQLSGGGAKGDGGTPSGDAGPTLGQTDEDIMNQMLNGGKASAAPSAPATAAPAPDTDDDIMKQMLQKK
jgi:C4-dicarboxylate transporter, DctM subunit